MTPLDGQRRDRKDSPSSRRRRRVPPASVVVAPGSRRPPSLDKVLRTVIEPALVTLVLEAGEERSA